MLNESSETGVDFYSSLFQRAFQGTVVTIETFLSWKACFEQDMAELKKKKLKEDDQSGKNKLTGGYGFTLENQSG